MSDTYTIYCTTPEGGLDVSVGNVVAPSAVAALEEFAENVCIADYSLDNGTAGRVILCPHMRRAFYYAYTEEVRAMPVRAIKRLEALIESEWAAGREIAVRIETMSECAWWGELRYTPEPNRQDDRPDRSYVLHATGEASPDGVVARLLAEFAIWRTNAQL